MLRALLASLVFTASAMASAADAAAARTGNPYVSNDYGFSIQAPATTARDASGYTIAAFFLPADHGFTGNVNVQRQAFNGTLDAYRQQSLGLLKQSGLTVIRETRQGNELRVESRGTMHGMPLHWYSRAVIAPPWVYLVTATTHEASWPAQKPVLLNAVESFRRQ